MFCPLGRQGETLKGQPQPSPPDITCRDYPPTLLHLPQYTALLLPRLHSHPVMYAAAIWVEVIELNARCCFY